MRKHAIESGQRAARHAHTLARGQFSMLVDMHAADFAALEFVNDIILDRGRHSGVAEKIVDAARRSNRRRRPYGQVSEQKKVVGEKWLDAVDERPAAEAAPHFDLWKIDKKMLARQIRLCRVFSIRLTRDHIPPLSSLGIALLFFTSKHAVSQKL